MEKVVATYINGAAVPDQPVDWPSGTRVEVSLLADSSPASNKLDDLRRALDDVDSYGLDESLWPDSREGRDLLLAHMAAAPPLQLSPAEMKRIDDDRLASKKTQKELTGNSWEELEKLF
jgi:hypothetical protein